jgi:hypothetical protein
MNTALRSDEMRTAMEQGDYALAVTLAAELAPGMDSQLGQFKIQMELYRQARSDADWRRALRAIADARIAAISAGLPELESIASHHLYQIVREHEGKR